MPALRIGKSVEEPLQILSLGLRATRVLRAASQFVENLARADAIHFRRNARLPAVAYAAAQAPERIALAFHAAFGLRFAARPAAHLRCETRHAIAKIAQRLFLRCACIGERTAPQGILRAAHGALGLAERLALF